MRLQYVFSVALMACALQSDAMFGKVIYISPKPSAPSGYLEAWIEIRIANDNKDIRSAYMRYIEENVSLPSMGQACTIKYHVGSVNGIVGNGSAPDKLDNARIVDDMLC